MGRAALHELTADGVSLLIDTSRGTPEVVHWGERLGEGDVLVLPKGWSGRWDITETVRKLFVLVD